MTEIFLPPAGTQWCPACGGMGERRYTDTSVSPYSGVTVLDPQCDFTEPCRTCFGECTVPDVTAPPKPGSAVTQAGRTPGSLLPPGGAQPHIFPKRPAPKRATTKQRPAPRRAA